MKNRVKNQIIGQYALFDTKFFEKPLFCAHSYSQFIDSVYKSNVLRLKIFYPLLIFIYMAIILVDIWAYQQTGPGTGDYYLYIILFQLFSLVALIIVAPFTIFKTGFLENEHFEKRRKMLIHFVAFLIPIQCSAVAIIDLFMTGLINAHFLGILSVTVVFILPNLIAFFLFSIVQLFFLGGLFYVHPELNSLVNHFVSSTILFIVALFVSRILFYGRMSNFNNQLALESSNKKLETQVQVRSEQLAENLQMASLGMQAAEIVHNLKNPLSVIRGYSVLLTDRYPQDKFVGHLVEASDRLEGIVCTILQNTANKTSDKQAEFLFDELIQDEIKMLKASSTFFKHRVDLELDLKSHIPFLGYPGQISQCLDNLLKNAVDAMFLSPEKKLFVQTFIDGKSIHIVIQDSGHGMGKDQIERIFDPFFTTKPSVKRTQDEPTGTGLGLPYCKRIIELHRGSINVESQVGVGTKFVLKFPLSI